jgi:DNA (cytosine-5)-methyltransferase 1
MFKQFTQYLHSKIMAHRGGKRIWIQGVKPQMAGFYIGAKYSVVDKGDNTIEIRLDPNGNRTVSRKAVAGTFMPVMDVRILGDNFSVDDRIRAVFFNGLIVVSLHHEDVARAEREKRFVKNLNEGTLSEASLCTGGGISAAATHQAIKDAGVQSKLAFVVDAELKYLSVAGANNFAIDDDTVFFCGAMEEIDRAFIGNRPVDVLSFSLPCAGLSRSGAAKHKLTPEEHSSSTSLFGLYNFINATNPAVLWSENVKEAQNSPLYTVLKAELIRRGYRIVEDVTANEKTGSLECRERYWFLAVSQGLDASLDADVFNYQLQRQHANLNAIRDAEADAEESRWAANQYLHDKAERDAQAGKGFARQLVTGVEQKVGTIGRFYSKKRSTEPFWVRADGKERLLSLREHAAVKSVPYSLVEGVCDTTGHEILGQSIDYLQAYMPIKRLFERAVAVYKKAQAVVAPAAQAPKAPAVKPVAKPVMSKFAVAF